MKIEYERSEGSKIYVSVYWRIQSMVHVVLGSFSDCMRICILHNPEVNVFLEILDHIKKVVRLRLSLSSWPALLVPLHGHICTVLGNC